MVNVVNELKKYSDPEKAQYNAYKYLGKEEGKLYKSTRKDKKYMILDPNTNKMVHFGAMGYEDYTKHNDDTRKFNYLKRSKNIKGNWKNNFFSPNNLSRIILWN